MSKLRDGAGRRGRTQRGRLALLDDWLCLAEWPSLGQLGGAIVDLGLGDTPDTTLELGAALGRAVVAVDHDPVRVEAARRAGLDARVGGFDLPIDEPVCFVRAMNVLRGYEPRDVPDAHRRLGALLIPGGLLIEGSTDADGAVLVAHLLRKTGEGLHRDGLLFSTDFRRGFAPRLFRDWLPRDVRRPTPGTELRDLLDRWTEAWASVRSLGEREPPAAFVASARRLADVDARHADRGHVVWRPEGGVPAWAAG